MVQYMMIYLWVLHGLHGAIKSWTQWGKVDEHVHIWVLLHGIAHVFVHRDENLFMAPVELLFVVPTVKQQCGKQFVRQWQDTVHLVIFITLNVQLRAITVTADQSKQTLTLTDHTYVNG